MKKILAAVMAFTMTCACVGMTACGGDKKDDNTFVVGISQLVAHDALDAATKGFKDALTEKVEAAGKKVEFDYQNASNDTTLCTTIANNFVAKEVDLIMANATPALVAAYESTETIPILGTSITEYGVALGLENFNGVVGSNVSGTSDLAPLSEQAQMMIDLLDLTAESKVAILYCSAEPNSQYQAEVVKAELAKSSITADFKTFTDSNDIAAVCNGIVGGEYDAVYAPTDNTVASNKEAIDNVLRPAQIPVFAGEEGICVGCGFATLSISYYNIGVKTGEMAAEILLNGADITKMAIAYDQNPVKKYNAQICAEYGIEIPEDYTVVAGTELAE